MRPHLSLLAVTTTVALLAAAPPPAVAATEHAALGPVSATLSYHRAGPGRYRDLHLTIARDGRVLHDAPLAVAGCAAPFCRPGDERGKHALTVADLDADGEPEVVADANAGGAHCCVISQVFRLRPDSTYAAVTHDWRDFGYTLRDLDADGRPEFRSGDTRFAYRYSSFASSRFPVAVWRLEGGRFANVTGAYPALVRADGRRWRRAYLRRRDDHGLRAGEQLGALAAWAADSYRLGHRAGMLGFLRAELRAGRLRGQPRGPHGSGFIADLDRFLIRSGYGGP
jgi:hypothetical protein